MPHSQYSSVEFSSFYLSHLAVRYGLIWTETDKEAAQFGEQSKTDGDLNEILLIRHFVH